MSFYSILVRKRDYLYRFEKCVPSFDLFSDEKCASDDSFNSKEIWIFICLCNIWNLFCNWFHFYVTMFCTINNNIFKILKFVQNTMSMNLDTKSFVYVFFSTIKFARVSHRARFFLFLLIDGDEHSHRGYEINEKVYS